MGRARVRTSAWILVGLTLLLGMPASAPAEEPESRSPVDILELYQRLQPGMAIGEVVRLAQPSAGLALGEAPTAWLLWRHSERGTEVLRTSFREGRLASVEYEAFGEAYRRLVKDGPGTIPVDRDELTLLWRRSTRIEQAAEDCQAALDAFHCLVMQLQDRLSPEEQRTWVRALELRRAAEAELKGLARHGQDVRPYEPDQLLLMPPSLDEWVPDDHLARFVREVVETLDLTAIEDTYTEERGYPPYHPRMMVAVLLYGYATGTYSSRKIARRLVEDVAMRFLAAGDQPDFRTLSEFRKRHGAALAALFTQVLRLCRRAGLVKLGQVAIDGTRVKANASKHKAMSYERMPQQEAALQAEIAELLRRAEQADRDEDARYGPDRRGDELPAELARRESRLQKIREAKAALEAEAREQAQQAGKDPAAGTPPPKAQRNFTDPESKIQKTPDGFIQGYNAQAAVDGHAQVIVAQTVTPMAADVGHLVPLVTAITGTLRRRPRRVLADAGYCSEENLLTLEEKRIDSYI